MKEFDCNMSTAYLPYKKRALIPNSMLIPIGTKVFTVYLRNIEEVQVNKYNQQMITMYYNTLYFLKEEDAEKVKLNTLNGKTWEITKSKVKGYVKEVAKDFECGIQLEKYNDIKEGDILEAYIMKEIKR